PQAANRPYAMLNLAQVLYLQAEVLEGKDDQASYVLGEADSVLRQLSNHHPAFAQISEAMYLHGNVLQRMSRPGDALLVWKNLAITGDPTKYNVYGHLKVGDYEFEHERPTAALERYYAALKILDTLKLE